MRSLSCAAVIAVALWAGPATAQDEQPAVGGSASQTPRSGTNIVGERESPIGLYITPWRKSAPEADIDRPARLLDVDAEPVDRAVFSRQTEYYHALSDALAAKAEVAPEASPAP